MSSESIDDDKLVEISTRCTVDQIAKWNGTQWNCADDVDTDTLMEISTSCTIDQIAKWDGTQWNCADSAENDEGGEVALRKLDCYILRDAYTKTKWVDFESELPNDFKKLLDLLNNLSS